MTSRRISPKAASSFAKDSPLGRDIEYFDGFTLERWSASVCVCRPTLERRAYDLNVEVRLDGSCTATAAAKCSHLATVEIKLKISVSTLARSNHRYR